MSDAEHYSLTINDVAHEVRDAWIGESLLYVLRERLGRLAPDVLPATECLADVVKRLIPYWEDAIVKDLRAGQVTLVAAHGNSLRALVKHLDGISDENIAALNIPTGIPLVYRLDRDLHPLVPGGEYLDPAAAAEATAAVAAQGKK